MSILENREENRWYFEDTLADIDSEMDMQQWWLEFLTYNGWTVESEVSPKNSRDRADLIIMKGDSPPIGIELKYGASGRKVGKGLHQIMQKYRNKQYPRFGFVNLWALCIFTNSMNANVSRPTNNEMPQIRELLCFFGIGTLGLSLKPEIDFSFSDRRCKVGLGSAQYPRHTRGGIETDFDIIEEKVADSVGGQTQAGSQACLGHFSID